MTTRAKMEWLIQIVFQVMGGAHRKCFRCEVYRLPDSKKRQMATALKMLGVADGHYSTFALHTADEVLEFYDTVRECGMKEEGVPDADWQRFIDEVVELVDGQGSHA